MDTYQHIMSMDRKLSTSDLQQQNALQWYMLVSQPQPMAENRDEICKGYQKLKQTDYSDKQMQEYLDSMFARGPCHEDLYGEYATEWERAYMMKQFKSQYAMTCTQTMRVDGAITTRELLFLPYSGVRARSIRTYHLLREFLGAISPKREVKEAMHVNKMRRGIKKHAIDILNELLGIPPLALICADYYH